MKIINIFVIVENKLYAAQFEGEKLNEFEKLRQNWQNVEFVYNFFKNRCQYLNLSIEDAVAKVLNEGQEFFNKLVEIAEEKTNLNLDNVFRALNDNEFTLKEYQESKYKKYFFRIYAVRLSENLYVVSGGGIKLVPKMKDDNVLNEELSKIRCLKNYLIEKDLYE